MKLINLSFITCIVPTVVSADPGHLAAVAGHSHWVAGAAIAVGVGLSLWGALTGGRAETGDAGDAEGAPEDAEAQEA